MNNRLTDYFPSGDDQKADLLAVGGETYGRIYSAGVASMADEVGRCRDERDAARIDAARLRIELASHRVRYREAAALADKANDARELSNNVAERAMDACDRLTSEVAARDRTIRTLRTLSNPRFVLVASATAFVAGLFAGWLL